MKEGDSQPEPLWTMPLHGLPCDHCWEPAKGLVVFEHARFVIHQNAQLQPCKGVNPDPDPPELPKVIFSKRKPITVKRKVGRPKAKK
jgi:hypothetical protein